MSDLAVTLPVPSANVWEQGFSLFKFVKIFKKVEKIEISKSQL